MQDASPPWPHPAPEEGRAPCGGAALPLSVPSVPAARPALMGVLNVTPDSFSDGGRYLDPEAAVARAQELVAAGADVLDIGGESTRPGAAPVDEREELRRVLPVIRAVAQQTRAAISIDTTKAGVAAAAVAAGATIVNDISGGLEDPKMLGTVAELRQGTGAPDLHLVLMHRQGDPATMQRNPTYGDPVLEVRNHLAERAQAAESAGIPRNRIALDPGIGFGKKLPHNLALLGRLHEFRSLGYPLLVGASRKSFIGHITGAENEGDWLSQERTDVPSERIGGTAAAVVLATLQGAEILRIHDVSVMREAVLVARAVARHCS